jgi:hypothetical protein
MLSGGGRVRGESLPLPGRPVVAVEPEPLRMVDDVHNRIHRRRLEHAEPIPRAELPPAASLQGLAPDKAAGVPSPESFAPSPRPSSRQVSTEPAAVSTSGVRRRCRQAPPCGREPPQVRHRRSNHHASGVPRPASTSRLPEVLQIAAAPGCLVLDGSRPHRVDRAQRVRDRRLVRSRWCCDPRRDRQRTRLHSTSRHHVHRSRNSPDNGVSRCSGRDCRASGIRRVRAVVRLMAAR